MMSQNQEPGNVGCGGPGLDHEGGEKGGCLLTLSAAVHPAVPHVCQVGWSSPAHVSPIVPELVG
jgi:hypothetical protein